MTQRNALMVADRPVRFQEVATAPLARSAPVSPLVVKQMVEALVRLNRKVDALAERQASPVVPVELAPVAEVEEVQPVSKTTGSINRRKLLEMFD